MGESITEPSHALTVYGLLLLAAGLIGLVLDLRRDAVGDRMTLPAWNISWLNFGFGIWLFIVGIFAMQSLIGFALDYVAPGEENTPLRALIFGTTFHGMALLLILAALRHPDRNLHLRANILHLRPVAMARVILLYFASGIALVIITGRIWEFILNLLAEAGLASPAMPQELVEIFAKGETGVVQILLIVLAVAVAPVTEEFIFRAGIYRFLKGRFSARFGLVVSSLLFAAMHYNALSFIPLFLIGMLLCRSYERTGNIYVPIGFHALFNANSVLLLHLQHL